MSTLKRFSEIILSGVPNDFVLGVFLWFRQSGTFLFFTVWCKFFVGWIRTLSPCAQYCFMFEWHLLVIPEVIIHWLNNWKNLQHTQYVGAFLFQLTSINNNIHIVLWTKKSEHYSPISSLIPIESDKVGCVTVVSIRNWSLCWRSTKSTTTVTVSQYDHKNTQNNHSVTKMLRKPKIRLTL